MRTAVNYSERAEECRRLAKLYTQPEDWAHFLEMAETWEALLNHHQEKSRSQTIALADRIRNVLFLPEDRSKETDESTITTKAA